MALTLRTDNGPDVVVDERNRLARVTIINGKTGKDCGFMALYAGAKNSVIYSSDRRRKEGDNRNAYVFRNPVDVEKVMRITGGGAAVKELLVQAGIKGDEILVSLDKMVVED